MPAGSPFVEDGFVEEGFATRGQVVVLYFAVETVRLAEFEATVTRELAFTGTPGGSFL